MKHHHQALLTHYFMVTFLPLLTLISLSTSAPIDKSYDLYFASSSSSSNSLSEEAQERQLATNYFIDNIIEAFVNSFASKLDPLRVQTFRLTFSKDFLGLQFNGEYDWSITKCFNQSHHDLHRLQGFTTSVDDQYCWNFMKWLLFTCCFQGKSKNLPPLLSTSDSYLLIFAFTSSRWCTHQKYYRDWTCKS